MKPKVTVIVEGDDDDSEYDDYLRFFMIHSRLFQLEQTLPFHASKKYRLFS